MKTPIIAAVSVLALGGVAFASYGGLSRSAQAEVLSAEPIRLSEPVYAEVVSVRPVEEQRPGSRQQCSERSVQRRAPERFGDRDGMLVGALIGGVVGNQVGGAIGKEVDRRHVGGRPYTETVRDCREVATTQSVVVGYDVEYRGEAGNGQLRLASAPGERVQIGERERVIGYDVRWRYGELEGESRLRELPGKRLPVENGRIAPSLLL